MSQTRRPAAILAADVAGYPRLMGEDNGEIGQCDKPRYHSVIAVRYASWLPVELAGPGCRRLVI